MNLVLWRVHNGAVGLTGWGWFFLAYVVMFLVPGCRHK